MSRIRIILLALFLLSATGLFSQTKIQVQGVSPSMHLVHTVAPKENWYSVGRTYNISPKELAPYNNTSMDKPLSIGQQLKIPLTAVNFTQDGKKAADEVFVPVYHQVAEKEWYFRISNNYNKIPVETLEKWNNVKNDQLKSGMWLVIGYLKVKTAQSSLAASGTKKIVPVTPSVGPEKESTAAVDPKKVPVTPPAIKKEEPQKPEPTKETKTEVMKPDVPKPEAPKPEVKEEAKTTEPVPVTVSNNGVPASHNGGAFKKWFSDKGGNTTGNAGIFRSTSGWNDGKYYALINNVPVGTIVKVTFSSTNKSIYAKVLGQLPDMKESVGLAVRISDAAASELGVGNTKFYVEVKY